MSTQVIQTDSERELTLLIDTVNAFAKRELPACKDKPFASAEIKAALKKAAQLGLFDIILATELGGMGAGAAHLASALRVIAEVDAAFAAIILTHVTAQTVLVAGGGDEGSLAPFNGEATALLSFPLYDEIALTARLITASKSDGYRLRGSVENLPLGAQASRAIVPAVLGQPDDGVAWCVVELTGCSTEPVSTIGMVSCPLVDLTLDSVPAHSLGGNGAAAAITESSCRTALLGAGAIAAGIINGAYHEALDYAVERKQGGRSIIDWSELRRMVAEMALASQTACMCLNDAAAAVDGGAPGATAKCRAAALTACELAGTVTTDGIQVLGGVGYMRDYGQEKRFRDAHQIQSVLGSPIRKTLQLLEDMEPELREPR